MILSHTTVHVGPDEPRPIVDTSTTLDGDLHLVIRLASGDGSTVAFHGPIAHVAGVLAKAAVAAETAQANHEGQRRYLARTGALR